MYGDLRDTGYNTTITNRMHYVVDPETVGQYSGEKDAIGQEIWEGDILQLGPTTEPIVCVFTHGQFALTTPENGDVEGAKWIAAFEPISPAVGYRTNLIVNGNIYDNPELLEQ